MDPINRYGYSYSFLYQFDTKQDCSMLTVPKLLVVGLLLKSIQTEMSLADEQWPLSSIFNLLYSDWAQLMQITGPGNKHYSGDKCLYPAHLLAINDII